MIIPSDYYFITFIHLYTYNYFFRVRWNNIQIDNLQAWSKLCGKVDSDVHLFSVT